MLEFPAFVLMGVYSPANRDESRDDFRLGFLEALDVRVRNLVAMGKQVILTGDLNVIRNEQDSTNMVEQLRKSGVSSEEWLSMPSRRLFNQLIFGGSVCGPRDPGREQPVLWDICRSFHPDREGMNTCWDTRKNTRPANNGSRIDYVLCSDGLKSWFVDANIQEGLMGSDHCPVYGVMGDSVSMICHKGVEGGSGSCSGSDAGKRQHRCEGASLLDVVNPPGMFVGGQRRHEWSQQKHLLPLSAKLIPEFDRRQSIRDMFTRKASTVSSKSGTAGPSAGRQRRASPSTQRDSGDASVTRDGEPQDGTEADGKPAAPGSQGTDGQASGPEDPTTTVGATKVSAQTTTTMASSVPVSSSASLQKQPKTKRPLPFGSNSPVKSKRIAPAAAAGGPKQKTIQGFFKPSVANTSAAPKADKDKAGDGDQASGIATDRGYPPPAPTATPLSAAVGADAQSSTGAHADPGASSIAQDEDDRVFDPIEAKESWSRLLGRRVVPRCEHDEPCISLVTKKPGINCGTCVPPPANTLL